MKLKLFDYRLNLFVPSFQKNTLCCIYEASALVTAIRTSRYVTLRIAWISLSVNKLEPQEKNTAVNFLFRSL